MAYHFLAIELISSKESYDLVIQIVVSFFGY